MVLVFAVVNVSFGDFVKTPCEPRYSDLKSPDLVGLYNCGSDQCPPNVKTDGVITKKEDLPLEGFFVYKSNGKFYKSPLKNFDPHEISGAGGNHDPMQLSADGKWLMLDNVKMISVDGGTVKSLAPVGKIAWVRNSASGNNDIVWHNKNAKKAYLATVDDNGERGDWTEIATDINITGGGFLAAGGSHMTWQLRASSVSYPWGASENTMDMGLWEIPFSGGTVGMDDRIDVCPLSVAGCGMTFSPDGSLLAANFEHVYQDCMPEHHKGFCVTPIREFTGAPEDWILQEDISVNWCPEIYTKEDQSTVNLRVGKAGVDEFPFPVSGGCAGCDADQYCDV